MIVFSAGDAEIDDLFKRTARTLFPIGPFGSVHPIENSKAFISNTNKNDLVLFSSISSQLGRLEVGRDEFVPSTTNQSVILEDLETNSGYDVGTLINGVSSNARDVHISKKLFEILCSSGRELIDLNSVISAESKNVVFCYNRFIKVSKVSGAIAEPFEYKGRAGRFFCLYEIVNTIKANFQILFVSHLINIKKGSKSVFLLNSGNQKDEDLGPSDSRLIYQIDKSTPQLGVTTAVMTNDDLTLLSHALAGVIVSRHITSKRIDDLFLYEVANEVFPKDFVDNYFKVVYDNLLAKYNITPDDIAKMNSSNATLFREKEDEMKTFFSKLIEDRGFQVNQLIVRLPPLSRCKRHTIEKIPEISESVIFIMGLFNDRVHRGRPIIGDPVIGDQNRANLNFFLPEYETIKIGVWSNSDSSPIEFAHYNMSVKYLDSSLIRRLTYNGEYLQDSVVGYMIFGHVPDGYDPFISSDVCHIWQKLCEKISLGRTIILEEQIEYDHYSIVVKECFSQILKALGINGRQWAIPPTLVPRLLTEMFLWPYTNGPVRAIQDAIKQRMNNVHGIDRRVNFKSERT